MHWGVGLNKKVLARFYYPKDSADLRLMIGALNFGNSSFWLGCVAEGLVERQICISVCLDFYHS